MDPQPSVWKSTLEEFHAQIAQGDGITGAVAVASMAAAFAVSLMLMVLEITARKKESEGHRRQIQELLEAARTEAQHLKRAADDDRAAYAAYRQAARLPQAGERQRAERQRAMRSTLEQASETPLRAARSAVRTIELCAQAATLVRGDIAADIAGAAEILHGAVRAILASLDANLRRMEDGGLVAERRELEERASHFVERVRSHT